MANDTHKITIGDNDVDLPKWASEETLKSLAESTSVSSIFAGVIAKYMKHNNIAIGELTADLRSTASGFAASTEITEAAKKKTIDKKLIGAAKATRNTVDKFSNTDAPLSSMVDMVGDLGSAMMGGGSAMAKNGASSNAAAAALSKAIPGLGALGASAMAWAGFQAAQMEQFAKAQETMINSGAIMFGGESPYEDLKQSVIQSGLTYTEMTKLVSKNGVAFQSLGTGVSSGTTAFTSMFKSVNETGDKFGDYGLRSAEMAEVLADYVNIQRMTLSKDMALASTQDGVKAGFHNLMIETTALASLTGENRSELLQKRLASLANPQVAAALSTMDEAGGGHAEVARSFIAQFALLENSMGPVGKDISDRFNNYIFSVADTPEDFDLAVGLGSELTAAMNGANNGVVDRINAVFRSGDVELANNMLVKEMAKMKDAQVGSSNVVVGSHQHLIQQLKSGGVMVNKQTKKMIDMSSEEYAAYLKEIEKKSNISGEMTEAMNDMKKSFVLIQDAFTLNLDTASSMAQNLASGLLSGAETIKSLLANDKSTKDNGVLSEEVYNSYYDQYNPKTGGSNNNQGGVGKGHGSEYNYHDQSLPNPVTPTAKPLSSSISTDGRDNNELSGILDGIVHTKVQTAMVLKQVTGAMTSIQRSKDYQKAVSNLA
jgi:hypothetical protein